MSGTDKDADGDTGTWTFTLEVTAGTLTETTPTPASTTVAASSTFSATVTVSGATGAVTYATTVTSPGLSVDPATGAITTTGTLAVADYTVSGTDKDADGDTGTWTFTLEVTAGTVIVSPILPSVPGPELTPIVILPVAKAVPPATSVIVAVPPPPPPVSIATATGSVPVGLTLSQVTVVPGQATVVSGSGCGAGADVDLFINGQRVGSSTANAEGGFSASVNPSGQGVGQLTVSATCGAKRFAAIVSVVATSTASSPEGSAAVFGIFVLLGVVLVRGQFNSSATLRRRKRRGAADILAEFDEPGA